MVDYFSHLNDREIVKEFGTVCDIQKAAEHKTSEVEHVIAVTNGVLASMPPTNVNVSVSVINQKVRTTRSFVDGLFKVGVVRLNELFSIILIMSEYLNDLLVIFNLSQLCVKSPCPDSIRSNRLTRSICDEPVAV